MNPYDKFDPAPSPKRTASGNPYDQFDPGSSPSLVSQIPGEPAPIEPDKTTGMLDKVKGAGEAALSIGSGALAAPIGAAAGIGRSLTSGQIGTPPGVQAGQETAGKVSKALTYQPGTQAGQDIMGGLGRAFESSKLGGLGPTEALAAGSIAKPSAGALKQAAAQSPEAFALKQGASKVGQAMRPNLDPQVAELAQKAQEMGMKIPPDMLSDNKFLRLLGQASREVPLSGSGVAGNRVAFNRAIIKAFGGDVRAEKISPQVFDQAMKQHGEMIGGISAKNPVPYSPQLAKRLEEHAFNAANFETSDVAKIIKSYTDEMGKLGRAKGMIDGEALRKLRTKLTGQMRRTNNGDLKHALSELDDTMLDAIQSTLGPEELQAFNQARRFYANGKTVEPLIAKAATKGQGDMSPAALAGRVTATSGGKSAAARGKAGDLADISAVGSRFMTEPGSSITAERGLTYSVLGGSGLANPLIPAGLYGAANAYNRLGPRITRGMIPRPPEP